MTLYIASGATFGLVTFNTPNLSTTHDLVLTSQWGKETITWSLTSFEANDRYSEFTLLFTDDQRKGHLEGIYNYQLLDGTTVVEEGLLKLVIEDGGSYGTQEYISNNDNLDATVYYRPEY
jgi:hypothetical protein